MSIWGCRVESGFISIESTELILEAILNFSKFCRFHRLPIESYDQFCKLVKKKFPHELGEGRNSSKDRKTIWKGIKLIKWSNADPLQEILTS